jgi:hypothetical protein
VVLGNTRQRCAAVSNLPDHSFRKACGHLNNCAVETLGLPKHERMWQAFPSMCVKAEFLIVR